MSLEQLRTGFGDAAVTLFEARRRDGASPEIDPALLGVALAEADIAVDARLLLDEAAALELVEKRIYYRCPVLACGQRIDAEAARNRQCDQCGTDYSETGDEPTEEAAYFTRTELGRLVPWLIAVHGFNTRGPWQEQFSWRIANRFAHHAPVLIYKYGLIRFSVLVRWRHRRLARQLGKQIRDAVAQACSNQIPEPPDMIVHSFGSQLFRLLLEMKEFEDLVFGRVIVCGGIIRPDFEWSRYIETGRINAVLAHLGGRDLPVRLAQFMIPGTGPGGKSGYADPGVINVMDDQFGHSGCFNEPALAENLAPGGLWDRYLRGPLSSFTDPRRLSPDPWKSAPRLLRGIVRLLVVILLFAIIAMTLWLSSTAIVETGEWLRSALERLGVWPGHAAH
jgi:uncharacterized protein (DUF983 family)